MKTHNFSAGPCILPQEVFKEASESLINFDNLSYFMYFVQLVMLRRGKRRALNALLSPPSVAPRRSSLSIIADDEDNERERAPPPGVDEDDEVSVKTAPSPPCPPLLSWIFF